MKRTTIEQLLVLAGLVAISVGLRFYFQDIPNFAPVAALALFAGYYFDTRWMAALAPLSVLMITDYFFGGYEPVLMLTVYGLLVLPVLLRDVLRRHFSMEGSGPWGVRAFAGLFGCTLAGSVLFFLVSNFVTWAGTPWYEPSLGGLGQCYLNALPFFRYTVTGDLCFAALLFGGYAAACQWAARPQIAFARG